jgi:signal transduction histidine kinase
MEVAGDTTAGGGKAGRGGAGSGDWPSDMFLEAIADPVFIKDTDLVYRACNARFAEVVLGRERNAVIGRRSAAFMGTRIAEVHESRDRALLLDGGAQTYEADIRYASGARGRARFVKGLLRDRAGAVTGILGVMHDISHEVELNRARVRAEQANAAKDRFLVNMSHQVRTPLNTMLGYAEALSLGIVGDVTARQREHLDSIQRAGRQLEEVLTVVLDVAHQGDPSRRETITALVPDEVCAEAVRQALPEAEKAGVALVMEDSDPLLAEHRVWVDARAMRHILRSLLASAIAFTRSGGRVSVSARLDRDRVAFRVSDSGGGLAGDHVRAILDRGHVGAGSSVLETPAPGVGLTIVKTLAAAMGGSLDLDSIPGRGTTATVSLPVDRRRDGGRRRS